jgi:hypothetical protein
VNSHLLYSQLDVRPLLAVKNWFYQTEHFLGDNDLPTVLVSFCEVGMQIKSPGLMEDCSPIEIYLLNISLYHSMPVVITPHAYAQTGLSNRFCPSVVVVCHNFF